MDDPQSGKAPTAEPRKLDAREARLAKALRANLRRRKACDGLAEPPAPKGAPDEQD